MDVDWTRKIESSNHTIGRRTGATRTAHKTSIVQYRCILCCVTIHTGIRWQFVYYKMDSAGWSIINFYFENVKENYYLLHLLASIFFENLKILLIKKLRRKKVFNRMMTSLFIYLISGKCSIFYSANFIRSVPPKIRSNRKIQHDR